MHGGISPDIRREREDQESGLYFGSQACRKLEWFLSVVTVEHLYGATSCILLTYLSVNGRPSGPVSIYWGAFGITFRVASTSSGSLASAALLLKLAAVIRHGGAVSQK
jgi:hypothetical protein